MNTGLQGKLILISAPAGFGKTTLLSQWLASLGPGSPNLHAAWLSLDEGDNDLARFLTYLVAALQTANPQVGEGVLSALQAPQIPPVELLLPSLLNEIAAIPDDWILILDDYHLIDSKPVEHAIAFLFEHLPPRMRLVIATRQDPSLPLARLRARGQLTELRLGDLRFSTTEAANFLNAVMGLDLSPADIAALEARTEGWIAGLQMAALALQGSISLQGQKESARFISSFTGSHRFVLDYLLEEVLEGQPEGIQNFLLRTSILDRLCGPLCDAVLLDPVTKGQETLEYLEHANLFIVPLDDERRWYRYHHLFAGLLQQRFQQQIKSLPAPPSTDLGVNLPDYHLRASAWFEDNGLELEAFRHAAAAQDIARCERLIEKGMPVHFPGAVAMILDWLKSLSTQELNRRPSLWWRYASLLLINGQTLGVEEKLSAAEAAVPSLVHPPAVHDGETRNLIGQIAAARATLALTRYDVDAMLAQSLRALEYLQPGSLFTRATAHWTLGYAYLLQGDRPSACRALNEAISLSQASGAAFTLILATIGLGNVQEADTQLVQAAETYRQVLKLAGDHPQQIIHEAHLGLARILYEWNDLDAAEFHGQQSLLLAQQYEQVIDRFIMCEVFLARLQLARGDIAAAAEMLARASQTARRQRFTHRLPEIATAQVLVLLRQGDLAEAAHLAQSNNQPLGLVRLHLAQGDSSSALSIVEPWLQQVGARGLQDERLKGMVLLALAFHLWGEKNKAQQVLGEVLAMAEPQGYIRLFIDEGLPMQNLLSEAAAQGLMPGYVHKLLAVFDSEPQLNKVASPQPNPPPLTAPLSPREKEVLQLIAQGFSNQEISERLFVAIDTVKGHTRRIFDKLKVHRRTEAVARARQLGLL